MILFESCVCCGQLTLTIISIYIYFRFIQGATTAEKSRGDQVFRPNTRALAPRARPKAELGVGCRMGSPPPAVMGRGITPWKFLKTQMLKPTFWWLLWNFLLFENYGQEVGGNTLLVPNLKVGDQFPRSLRLLRLWIYWCLSVCILCVFVSYCIVIVLSWARWGGPDEIEA